MTDFASIRERAAERKGGDDVLSSLLGTAARNADVATLSDDRILSAMSERIFAAGFVWRVITAKWPDFEEAFLGFEPRRLIFQPDDFWYDLAADKRIVRNPQKIRAVRENVAFVERISSENNGFGRFLAEWRADDQIGLMAWLNKNGSRLGGNTGQYFLRWIGWDAFVLSLDAIAALRQSGLEIAPNPTSMRDLARIQEQMNAWRIETGLCYRHLSRILAMSSGENRSPEALERYMGGGGEE